MYELIKKFHFTATCKRRQKGEQLPSREGRRMTKVAREEVSIVFRQIVDYNRGGRELCIPRDCDHRRDW